MGRRMLDASVSSPCRPRGRRGRLRPAPEILEARSLLSGVTISDSGGFEGSNQVLKLGSKGGGRIEYTYEHYSIPDNFIIRYEGRNLLETGFVGGGRSGTIQVPAGNSDTAQIIVATNDSGTAWDYTVTADACPDTTPFNIQLAGGGDFTHKTDANGDLTCEGAGTIYIGRTDGIGQMIRVDDATVSFDKNEARISGTVYAMMGAGGLLTKPLFTGSFTLPFKSGVATKFVDVAAAGQYQYGGMDVDFTGLAINRDTLSLGAKFKLIDAFGVSDVLFSGPDALIITQTDARFGPSVKLSAPNFKAFNLFGFLPVVEFSDFSIELIAPEDTVKIQGKVTLDVKLKGTNNKITADLSGSNYIRIKGGKLDVKGELTVESDLEFPKGWGLKEVKIKVDTEKHTIDGTAKLMFPFRGKALEGTGTIGFALPIPPLELNKLGLGLDKLNHPIPSFPYVFFQGFQGSVEHFADSDPAPTEYTGGLSATLGPLYTSTVDIPDLGVKAGGTAAMLRLDLTGTISSEAVKGTSVLTLLAPKVGRATGTTTLDWNKGTFDHTGAFTFLDGLIQAATSLKTDKKFNISIGGSATVGIPNYIKVFGGAQLASGSFLLDISNNGLSSDDFIASWRIISLQKVGPNLTFAAGLKTYFDGRVEVIGPKNLPPKIGASAQRSLAAAALEAPVVGSWDVGPDQPWVLLGADWENDFDGEVALRVRRPDGVWIEEPDFEANGVSVVDELSDSRTRVVVVAAPEAGNWQLEVVDPDAALGAVSYSGASQDVAPTIAVLTPSTTVPGGSVAITYSAADPDSDAQVQLFYDDDGEGFDGIPFASGLAEGDGSFTWDTRGVAAGDYHIYAMVSDGANPPVYAYAPGTVHIDESADLSASLDVSPGTILTGAEAAFTYTVSNAGPSQAQGVQAAGALAGTLATTSDAAWYGVAARAGDSFVFETSTDDGSLDPALELLGPGGASLAYDASGAADGRNARIAFVAPADGVYRLKVAAEGGTAGAYTFNATLAVGDLAGGASRSFEIRATAPASPGAWGARMETTSATFDPTASDDFDDLSAFVQAPPVASPDLEVVAKPTTPAVMGGEFTYELTITNHGQGAATNVVLTESIPYAAADYVRSQVSRGVSYDFGSSVVAELGTLAPGESAALRITLRPFAAGDLVSTTSVVSDQEDARTLDNNLITVNPVSNVAPTPADLELSLTVDQAAPQVGDEIVFQLTLANKGPGVASGVQVFLPAPVGLEFIDGFPEQGTYDQATGVWDVGNIRDALTRTLVIRARVVYAAVPIRVAAEVARVAEFDPDSTPNNGAAAEDDYASVVVADRVLVANLGLTVAGPSGQAAPGEPFAYTITVVNAGPDAASPVVWVALPAGVELVGAPPGAAYDSTSRAVAIPLGALASGGRSEVYLGVRPTSAAAGTTIRTTFTLISDASDPVATDDGPVTVATDVAAIGGQARADLRVASSVGQAKAVVGDLVAQTFWLANEGPDAATGVTLSIPTPPGLEFIDADAGRGAVAFDGRSVAARIGPLAVGEAVAVTVRLRALAAGSPTLFAAAKADQFDPDGSDDAAGSTIAIAAPSGPRVVGLQRVGRSPRSTSIVLTFDEALGGTGVHDASQYLVTAPGRDRRLGTADDRIIRVASARLSPDGRSVSLKPASSLALFGRYGLFVSGAAGGPASVDGRLIDGDGDGIAGGDYRTTFGREAFVATGRPFVRRLPPRWPTLLRPSSATSASWRLRAGYSGSF